MIVTKQEFFKAQQKLQNIPFNQTEEWFEKCCFEEANCRFFIDDLSNPHIGCWGIVFKRKFIGEHLIISGESYKNIITSHHIRDFYSKIISCGFEIVEITSLQFYDTKFEIGIRRSGFLRPMIANLSPLTIVISTFENRKTHKIWNKNIRLAKEAMLTFECIESPTIEHTEIFCKMFEELKSAKKLNYNFNAQDLLKLFQRNKYKLFFTYNKDKVPVAGRIIYCTDELAYDVHAANTTDSRNSGAAYYIINEIINYLKTVGISNFDYGMISPCNNEMDNVYRSKSYSGGTPTLYNGQWVFYRSKVLEYLIKGYLYFFMKSSRY